MSDHEPPPAGFACPRCESVRSSHGEAHVIHPPPTRDADTMRRLAVWDLAVLEQRLESRERFLRQLADPETAARVAGCWSLRMADAIHRELAR